MSCMDEPPDTEGPVAVGIPDGIDGASMEDEKGVSHESLIHQLTYPTKPVGTLRFPLGRGVGQQLGDDFRV